MSGKAKTILIAEDNEDAARLIEQAIKSYFSDKNLTVLSARTLEKALSLARLRGPVAVGLIDLELEDAKPTKTLQCLRQLGENVIVMSGVASGDERRNAKRFGARDYIEKPIVIELLIEKLARTLDNHEPDADYGEVQLRAQANLQQKSLAAPSIVLSPVSSRWLKVILPATGIVVSILAVVIGYVLGGWSTAKAAGAKEQAINDHFATIDSALEDLKTTRRASDKVMRRIELNQVKQMAKAGIEPVKDDEGGG